MKIHTQDSPWRNRNKIRYALSLLYLALTKTSCIRRLKNFSSEHAQEIFDFIQYESFGIFSPMQNKKEYVELLHILQKQCPKYILEIGTANGGSLFCLCKVASSNATLISVDMPGGNFGSGYSASKIPFYSAFTKQKQTLHLIRKDSHTKETLEEITALLASAPIDFLLIDGDHSYEGVKKDFELYAPLVKKGGIIAFHDINPDSSPQFAGGAPRFWNEIKTHYKNKEIIRDTRHLGFGIGVLFV